MVIDSYEAAQAHRDEANQPNVGHDKRDLETTQAEPATETTAASRPPRKTAAKR